MWFVARFGARFVTGFGAGFEFQLAFLSKGARRAHCGVKFPFPG